MGGLSCAMVTMVDAGPGAVGGWVGVGGVGQWFATGWMGLVRITVGVSQLVIHTGHVG